MLEKPKIQLKLNALASGWLAVELSVNHYHCTFMASNIPQDPLYALTDALCSAFLSSSLESVLYCDKSILLVIIITLEIKYFLLDMIVNH